MVAERDHVVDIERARKECEDDPRSEQVMGKERTKNVLRSLELTKSFKGSDEGEDSSDSSRNSVRTSFDEFNDIESLISSKSEGEKSEHNQRVLLIGRTQSKEKHKNRNSKKPPRPRKGPSLTTSDLRLVKEISELVMKKRARALKKVRALAARPSSSSSSSNISLFSMIITVLFFIVIIIQVFDSSKNSTLNFHEKPEPSTQSTSGLGSS